MQNKKMGYGEKLTMEVNDHLQTCLQFSKNRLIIILKTVLYLNCKAF